MNKVLAKKLNKLANIDQRAVRQRQQKGIVDKNLIKRHTEALKSIVLRYGWPTISLVGKKASRSAWLLVQHSDDVAFQKKCLKLMAAAYKKNPRSVDPMHIAFLTDRIHVVEKKSQKFGTQFRVNKNGKLVLLPILDIKNIDKRRADYNIEPLAEYLRAAKSFRPAPIKKIIK